MAKTPVRKRTATGKRRTPPSSPRRSARTQVEDEAVAPVLLVHAFEVVYVIDTTGTMRYVSPASTHVLGYQPAELLGKDSFTFIHPDDVPRLRDAITELLRRPHATATREYRFRHHDGTWRSVEGVLTSRLEDPAVAGLVINARDITERLHSELALRDSEERYRQLVELSPEPLLVHVDEKIAYVNAACVALFGARSAEEILGTPIWDVLHPDSRDVIQRRLHQIRTEGRAPLLQAVTLLRVDGQPVTVEVAGAAIRYQGRPAVQAVIRVVGEQQWVEEAQRATEENYRELFENANDAIATFTVEGIIQRVNRGAERLLGWNREELIGQSYHKVLTPTAQALADDRTQRFLAGETMDSRFEIDLMHKDGHLIPVDARTRPIRNREGRTVGFQGVYRDMTVRRQMEMVVQENRRLLERIADTLPEIVYLYDYPSHQTVYVNRQVMQVLGYTPEQLQGAPGPFKPLLHSEDTAQWGTQQQRLATAADGARIEAIYRVRHVNGSYRWLQSRETIFRRTADDHPLQIFGVAQDVTARQRLRQLGQAQRLPLEELPERLRAFRDRLGLTQTAFGQTFGGYNARQITSYERGQIDIPLKLLLAIHTQGYLLEAVFGTGDDALLEETVHYLTESYPDRLLAVELTATVLRLLVRDRTTIERVLHALGLPMKDLPTEQRRVLEQLAGIAPSHPGPVR